MVKEKIEENVLNKIVWLLRDPNSWKKQEFIPGKTKVLYAEAIFDKNEYIRWIKSAFSGWFGLGKEGEELERELATYIDKKYALLCNSGSSAILLMMAAIKDKTYPNHLKNGDEIILSANSFSTTVSSILNQQLVPVYIDPELGTYNPSVKKFREAISEKTKAILITHTLGNPNEINEILKLCEEKNLILIEDNSDALGSIYMGKKTGSFGLMSSYSFYPAHHITTGEGGAVLTEDTKLLKILRSIRDWGRDCWCEGNCLEKLGRCEKRFDWEIETESGTIKIDHKHLFSRQGFNLKSTEQQAAFGLEQIKRIEDFNYIRRKNFRQLYNGLKQYEDYFILPKATPNSDPSWFSFPLTIKKNAFFNRSDIQKFLADKNIETRVMFGGNISAHPGFKGTGRIHGELKNANFILSNTFLLGCHQGLTFEMIDYVLKCIDEFIETNNYIPPPKSLNKNF
jgi:CDP-6-deoxy-D-xylo-4-hexulose-3-dehydrase